MNFTRWSARLPGTQRRAAARTEHTAAPTAAPDKRGEGSVPAARVEQLTDDAPPGLAVDELPVHAVLDRVPALVALVHGPEHRVSYVNDAYTAAFGVRPVDEDDRDVAERAVAQGRDGVHVEEPTVADDPYAVGRVLHLVERVR